MKTRQEIKALAKQSFSENYWVCVGATLLAFVVIGAASGVTSFLGGLGGLIVWAPMMVGLQFFSLWIYRGELPAPTIEDMFKTGFSDFGRKLGGDAMDGIIYFSLVPAICGTRYYQGPCLFIHPLYFSRIPQCAGYRSR